MERNAVYITKKESLQLSFLNDVGKIVDKYREKSSQHPNQDKNSPTSWTQTLILLISNLFQDMSEADTLDVIKQSLNVCFNRDYVVED